MRYDPDNLAALDFGCHSYLDGNPLEKIAFWEQLLGTEKFEMLNSRARIISPVDKSAVELYLREKLKELGGK